MDKKSLRPEKAYLPLDKSGEKVSRARAALQRDTFLLARTEMTKNRLFEALWQAGLAEYLNTTK